MANYQALYRKYRPQTFDDVVGQLAITQTLKTQLQNGQLSHAYLFTGSRGTGKTSCAKILAKAVNCENPQDGNPCNCCPSCRAIDSGACMDVLEIDAASNNGVDNVRDLRDDAVYTPSQVKMRVYIIDEVHMLSISAFNTLLKIIEEPPEHLLFILATTELHKVPATILSRCQRFSFRRISQEDIAARLQYVAYQENIDLEESAARVLSRMADGGMRDALSLLDQCAAATVGELNADRVYACLGIAGQQKATEMMAYIARHDTRKLLSLFNRLYADGKDLGAMLDELACLARDLLVLQTAPGVYNDTILDGLDYLMAELEKRGMKAVLFLNNAWEWSGGYGTYLEWAGAGHQPNPAIDGYPAYMEAMAAFCTNDSAKALAIDHARRMAARTNRYTGRPYAESPAIMSWQVANEPRAFSGDSAVKAAFADYIIATARAIKAEDPNHMVSTGSEGLHGCEYDMALWRRIHVAPEIDYGILQLWPYNWSWIDSTTVASGVDTAFAKAVAYITPHYEAMRAAGKPLVLEEFGYPRDNMATAPGSATTGRDGFYSRIFNLIATSGMINGCNFWGWGGYAMPPHKTWQPWDPYTGDPAQEPQGLNSVFAADSSTLAIIRSSVDAIKNARHE